MSLQYYVNLANDVEIWMDEADYAASTSNVRYTHNEVFSRLKDGLDG